MKTNGIYSGLLSDYFEIVAFKTLSKVDTTLGSNQHEFNVYKSLKNASGYEFFYTKQHILQGSA
jgi:hypothetical protein